MQTEIDIDSGMPEDELHNDTKSWLQSLGVTYTKLSEILAAGPCPKVRYRIILNYRIDSKKTATSYNM